MVLKSTSGGTNKYHLWNNAALEGDAVRDEDLSLRIVRNSRRLILLHAHAALVVGSGVELHAQRPVVRRHVGVKSHLTRKQGVEGHGKEQGGKGEQGGEI